MKYSHTNEATQPIQLQKVAPVVWQMGGLWVLLTSELTFPLLSHSVTKVKPAIEDEMFIGNVKNVENST